MSAKRFAIIENGSVVNVILADDKFIASFYPNAIECDDLVCPGYAYDGSNFFIPLIEPEVIDELEAE